MTATEHMCITIAGTPGDMSPGIETTMVTTGMTNGPGICCWVLPSHSPWSFTQITGTMHDMVDTIEGIATDPALQPSSLSCLDQRMVFRQVARDPQDQLVLHIGFVFLPFGKRLHQLIVNQ